MKALKTGSESPVDTVSTNFDNNNVTRAKGLEHHDPIHLITVFSIKGSWFS